MSLIVGSLKLVLSYQEAYSESCQTSVMEFVEKIVNAFQSLMTFAKRTILDAWQGSEYNSIYAIRRRLGHLHTNMVFALQLGYRGYPFCSENSAWVLT